MKTWKKVLIFIVLGIVGLFACLMIYGALQDEIERYKIEANLSLAQKELENNNFKAVDSILNDVGYRSGRVENGDKTVEDLKAGIERGKFIVEVDKLKKAIKEKDYSFAKSLQEKLMTESISNKVLTKEDKKYYRSTFGELIEAMGNEMKPYLEKAKQGLVNMSVKEDKFNKYKWFQYKTSPKYVDTNGFFLLFGEEQGDVITSLKPLALKVQYYGGNWVFHKEFQLLIDGESYTFKPKDIERDSGNGGYVWEWSTQTLEDYTSELYTSKVLVSVIKSKETKIRFVGKSYQERTITENEKQALKNVILSYVAKGGYFKFIDKVVN